MRIRIAGFQMPVQTEIGANVTFLLQAVDRAADASADILLTPEGSLSGYTHQFDAAAAAVGLRQVTDQARTRGLGLALGTCFVEPDGRCYNQLRFYRPDGTYLGFHSKTLCCGTLDEPPIGEINHYSVAPLRTFEWQAGLQIGGLICNDMWANPECTPMPDSHLSQQLARMGARILFHAVNSGPDGTEWGSVSRSYHEANLRMRARAGRLWIVTVDNASLLRIPCAAPSGVLGPDGAWRCRVDFQGPQFFLDDIELQL